MQLAAADWIVITLYFVAVAAIGIVAGLRVKDSSHYFLGGRGFGRWLMIGQSFGVGTHAEMPVSLAGAVSQVGISGIWYQWKNLFATPFYWLFAPLLRRVRRTTTAEMTEDRYGRWMSGLYIVFALLFFTIGSAGMLKGGAKVISQAAGGQVNADQIIVAMTVAFIAYSFIGGLVASAWTDFFQGFLIIALSFMLIPLGWGHVGGLAGMKAALQPSMFSLATPEGIGVWYIAMLTLNGLVGILAQPHQIAAVGSGRDELACREGFFWGNYVKRVCTVGWAIVGLMVAALLVRGTFGIDRLEDQEQAFGFACRHLLFPGALGLLIACVLAGQHVDRLGVHGLERRPVHRGPVPPPHRPGPDGRPLPARRPAERVPDRDARRALRLLPRRQGAARLPAHGDDVDLHGHRPARRHRLAAGQPLGRAGQPKDSPVNGTSSTVFRPMSDS